ncbi:MULTISPECIES: hypothetical protein [unclassified Microbacterium]|uniref:hypothetical protein n=1 Tax=unclassified Microbacterium TaxID=2609290 RepID=UPI00366234F1
MRNHIIMAGVDWEFQGVDFQVLATNRRKYLTRQNTAKADLRFLMMDVRAGQVTRVDVTYPGGVKTETSSVVATFGAVARSSIGTFTDSAGVSRTGFKPGQFSVMSITDLYAAVRDIGQNAPGTLQEVSFFGHGWMGGLILVNSFDDRSPIIPVPSTGGAPTTITATLGPTQRDPNDKDSRGEYDFVAPTQDAAALTLFKAAFATDGFSWLWGCAFPRVIHHAMWAMEGAKGYATSGTDDDTVLTLDRVVKEDVDYIEGFLLPILKTPFPSRSTITTKFKFLKYVFCAANASAFAAQLATATGKPVLAALLGTYAEYDDPPDMMHVHTGFTAHVAFYKNYVGMSMDPEGRGYGVYQPGLTCTAPSVP